MAVTRKVLVKGWLSKVDLLVLTYLDQLHFKQKILLNFFHKTSCLNEEVNCTVPSCTVSIPCRNHRQGIELDQVSEMIFITNTICKFNQCKQAFSLEPSLIKLDTLDCILYRCFHFNQFHLIVNSCNVHVLYKKILSNKFDLFWTRTFFLYKHAF